MRRTADRIRHAISFEVIGLLVAIPLGAWAFGLEMHAIGVIALVGATLATLWNYLFNLGFDRAMIYWVGHSRKWPVLRVFHALLFEAGLLAMLLPFIAWHLQIGIWAALVMDLGFAGFYLVYAFVYNWAYDLVFPIPARPTTD
ncbi:PACE efflux transporter [Pseudophaeobacter flagellatus]|uniref:PACE efflux transporter n=1 Tax=Pseudophaeobacter flagellatus TaxID=2899119 RepID=UPI001E5398ED|nr:PACE efflux transporter [Pseudophaeobacter flagellatus]MCD9146942.1 PACE efflux transporter [Pseudophaeobacter flagellatus]